MIETFTPDKHQNIWVHKNYSLNPAQLDYPEEVVVFWYYTHRIPALKRHLKNEDLSPDSEEGIKSCLLLMIL